MFFIDRVKIRVTSGNGGNGCISFTRAKFIPFGPPDGGHGGNGGNVTLSTNININTLADFRSNATYIASNGLAGSKKRCSGKNGASITLNVPIGTQVFNEEMDCMLCDLNTSSSSYIIAHGGRGGIGNMSTQKEELAQGESGESGTFILQFKIICDVALIGLPNVGKSSYLSKSSAAKPIIGDYAFTTKHPTLGFVEVANFDGFVMADLPGIVIGSSDDHRIGCKTLGHTERAKIFLHILDASSESLISDYEVVNNELQQHHDEVSIPQIIALNKIDLLDDEMLQKQVELIENHTRTKCFCVSTTRSIGITALNQALNDQLKS